LGGDLEIRPAVLDDAWPLAVGLRECDFEEAFAVAGPNIHATLRAAIRASDLCWTVTRNDKIVFVIGCARVSDGLGSPWLMATSLVDRFPGALTKITKRQVAVMRESYPALVNYVDARNVASHRWLERIGFTVAAEPEPFGLYGRPFHRFTMGL
jgi:hypothetical protein